MKIGHLIILLFISAVLSAMGCSLIGATVGDSTDRRIGKYNYEILPDEYYELKAGNNLSLELTKGYSLNCRFLNWIVMPDSKYAQIINQHFSENSDTLKLPNLGEVIIMSDLSGQQQKSRFYGLDYKLFWHLPEKSKSPAAISLNEYNFIAFGGSDTLWADQFAKQLNLTDFRRVTGIVVLNGNESIRFSLSEINKINRVAGTNYAATGLLIGALIDVVLIVSAVLLAAALEGTALD